MYYFEYCSQTLNTEKENCIGNFITQIVKRAKQSLDPWPITEDKAVQLLEAKADVS